MLELARALPKDDEKFFGGWILAGIEAHIKGPATRYTTKTVLNKSHRAILEVQGTSVFGTELKKLRSFLVLPVAPVAGQTPLEGVPEGRLLFAHYFTPQEVSDYVAYTGDENIIHKGEQPIVPGLCMACYLQEALNMSALDWRISFLSIVRTGELVSFYQAEGQISAYVDKIPAFTVKLL